MPNETQQKAGVGVVLAASVVSSLLIGGLGGYYLAANSNRNAGGLRITQPVARAVDPTTASRARRVASGWNLSERTALLSAARAADPTTTTTAPIGHEAWITQHGAGVLTVLDDATSTPVAVYQQAGKWVTGEEFSPDGTLVFISEDSNFKNAPSRVGIYNRKHVVQCDGSGQPTCPKADTPINLATTSSQIFWANNSNDTIGFADNSSPFGNRGTINLNSPGGPLCQGPWGVRLRPNSNELWVACLTDVRVIDTAAKTVTHIISDPVGLTNVFTIVFYANGSKALATNNKDIPVFDPNPGAKGDTAIIDANKYSVVGQIATGDSFDATCVGNGDCFVSSAVDSFNHSHVYWIRDGALYDSRDVTSDGGCGQLISTDADTKSSPTTLVMACWSSNAVLRYSYPSPGGSSNWSSTCGANNGSCVQSSTFVTSPGKVKIAPSP